MLNLRGFFLIFLLKLGKSKILKIKYKVIKKSRVELLVVLSWLRDKNEIILNREKRKKEEEEDFSNFYDFLCF